MSDDIKLRYGKVESLADVENLVGKAIESARTMKQRVQYAAVGLMIFSTTDAKKSVELANHLVNQLGKGVKAEGLVKFFVDKAGFRLDAEGKAFESVKGEQWIRDNLESAKSTPWWSYAPATPFQMFTLEDELRKVIKKAKGKIKHAEEHPEDADLVHVDADMIETLEALLGGNPVTAEGAVKLISRITPKQKAA